MDRFQYGVDAVRGNPSPELVRWLDQDAPKGRENILIDYDNVQSDKRPSSSTDEIILAYREFQPITHESHRYPEQLYRYVLKPVRGITAEKILKQGKGKYIVDNDGKWTYPALMPDTVTDGTVTTDWQFCFQCFGGRSNSHHNLTVADLTRIKAENRYSSSETPRTKIRKLSFLSKEKVAGIWGLGQNPVLTGKVASEALEGYRAQKATLMAEINGIDNHKQAYEDFIKNTYRPLTFKGWAKTQGCAAEPVGYKWYGDDRVGNDNEALRENRRFINCTSKALETYDLAAYINQYSNLKVKEKTLRDNIKGYQQSEYRVKIHSAERMMDDAVADLEFASRQIEEVFEQRRLNAEVAQARAQNEAWADQEIRNSVNAVQWRNEEVNQVLESNRRMIAQIKFQARSHANHAKQKAQAQSRQIAKRGSEQNQSSTSSQTNNTEAGENTKQAVRKSEPVQPSANRILDSARDYKMTGTSTSYYGQNTAIDLAQTNLKNQAAKFCGDTFRTQITWSEPHCEQHETDETYMCSQNGLVNCWQQRCRTEYCGNQ
jgi:hypothetical protein